MLRKNTSSGTTFTGGDVSSALTPSSDNTLSVGTAAKRFANGHFTTVNSAAFTSPTGSGMVHTADAANSGTNVAHIFNNTTALTGTTILASFRSNNAEKIAIEDNGSIVPAADATSDLGSGSKYYNNTFAWNSYIGTIFSKGAGAVTLKGQAADNSSAVGVTSDCVTAMTTAGGEIHRFNNAGTKKAFIDKDGQFEETVAGKGIILKSPDGTRYLLTIANGGTVSVSAA